MAKRTITELIDDLDGSPAEVSRELALDGVAYTVDLSAANSARLDKALAPFIGAGSKIGRGGPRLRLGGIRFYRFLRSWYPLMPHPARLGLRVFEACGASIRDLREEHGHRVVRVRGKGGKVVLVPLPPAVARAIDRAVDGRTNGPDPAQQDRRTDGPPLRHSPAQALAANAGIRMPRLPP